MVESRVFDRKGKFQDQPEKRSYSPITRPEASDNDILVGTRRSNFSIFTPRALKSITHVQIFRLNLDVSSSMNHPISAVQKDDLKCRRNDEYDGTTMETQTSFPIRRSKSLCQHRPSCRSFLKIFLNFFTFFWTGR